MDLPLSLKSNSFPVGQILPNILDMEIHKTKH